MIKTFILLLFAHFLADFSLQTEVMAKMKYRKNDIKRGEELSWKFNGEKYQLTWFYWLIAHASIQGAMVYIFTGNIWMAVLECFLHYIIDTLKTEGYTHIHQDQALHLLTKIIYVIIWL